MATRKKQETNNQNILLRIESKVNRLDADVQQLLMDREQAEFPRKLIVCCQWLRNSLNDGTVGYGKYGYHMIVYQSGRCRKKAVTLTRCLKCGTWIDPRYPEPV